MADTKIKTNAKFEAGENSTGVLHFEIPVEIVQDSINTAFERNRKNVSVPGFRKGKIPKEIFFQRFGEESLYQEALDHALPQVYDTATEEAGITVVGRPQIEPESIGKNQAWKLKANVQLAPKVTLGDYKKIEIEPVEAKVEDSQIDEELTRLRESQAELVPAKDKTAKAMLGDQVVIDFDGSVDGEHFDGGKSENYSLTLGSGQFIPGFEDQIVGHKVDDKFDVVVKFPENYQAADLAGKDAVFAVVLHEIKQRQLPELDDEFAKDVDPKIKTLDELKKSIRERFEKNAEDEKEARFEEAAIQKVVDLSSLENGDKVPQNMIDEDVQHQIDQYFAGMAQQGINPQMYYQLTGTTEKDMRDNFSKEAPTRVKTDLVLEEIGRTEKMEPTSKEISEEIERLSKEYGLTTDQVRQTLSDRLLKHDIVIRKVVDLIVDNTKVKK